MMFPGIAKKTRSHCGIGMCVLGISCFIVTGSALAMQGNSRLLGDSPVPHATNSIHSATSGSGNTGKQQVGTPEKKPEKPTNPADALAQPAAVTLKDGELTVNANNSDLRQILRDVSNLSGMTIDGLPASGRIFGVYGPGKPSDVLTALLSGSRYNFVLVGSGSNGAPRKLLLTSKTGKASTAAEVPASSTSADTPADTPPPPVVQDTQDQPSRDARMKQWMQRLQAQHQQQQENATPQ